MTIISNTINYSCDDTLLEGFFAYDNSVTARKPAVLISHAWGGRDEFIHKKAEEIAALGYVAFALDMYGQGKTGQSIEENSALMQPLIENRTLLQKRIQAALCAIKLLPWVDDNKIAAIGFCFGGLCVLDLARSGVDIKGVVSFHGLLNPLPTDDNTVINAKILVLNGYNDPMNPTSSIDVFTEEMNAKEADWQLHHYGHTLHAFTNPKANDYQLGTVYNPTANKRAWQSMCSFLTEIFS